MPLLLLLLLLGILLVSDRDSARFFCALKSESCKAGCRITVARKLESRENTRVLLVVFS